MQLYKLSIDLRNDNIVQNVLLRALRFKILLKIAMIRMSLPESNFWEG